MYLVTCRSPGTTGIPTFEAILAPVALTCFGQLPHELYMATEHLPTAAHFSTAAQTLAYRWAN